MSLHRSPDGRFDANLRIVTRAGIEPPPAIAALRQRLDNFQRTAFDNSALDQIVGAIIDGTDLDPGLLWAAACGEVSIPDARKNELIGAVRERVNRTARAAYSDVAVDNYKVIADRFDTSAQAFTVAAAICDPNTPADNVVAATDKIRKAWQASATHAAELDRLTPVLRAAAELAGLCGTADDDVIDLCVDGNGMDREQLLDAWHTPDREAVAARQATGPMNRPVLTNTRGGRWTALVVQAGAVLRARPVSALEPATA